MAALTDTVGWVTIEEAIDLWADAPGEEEDGFKDLASLLGAAHEVLAPMGPVVAAEAQTPERYKQAQLLYSQHLWSRRQGGNAESYGPEGVQVSTFPMVLEAYSLMRAGRRTARGLV